MTVEQKLSSVDEQLAQLTIVVGELVKSSIQQRERISDLVSGMGQMLEAPTEFNLELVELKQDIAELRKSISELKEGISELKETIVAGFSEVKETIVASFSEVKTVTQQQAQNIATLAEVAKLQQQMIERLIQARS
jgi:chromosome segregation ATPase